MGDNEYNQKDSGFDVWRFLKSVLTLTKSSVFIMLMKKYDMIERKARHTMQMVAWTIISSILAIIGAVFLLVGLAQAINEVLGSTWLGTLILGIVLIIIGLVICEIIKSKKRRHEERLWRKEEYYNDRYRRRRYDYYDRDDNYNNY